MSICLYLKNPKFFRTEIIMEDENINNLLAVLYDNLTPKGFEILLKDLLDKLGFDDIEVTGQSGDSGIDLTATLRKSEIPGIETNIPYKIQAKRIAPDMTINPRYIRELRGAMSSGERGILITTAKVSRKSMEEEALKDISRLVLVIDGEKLIDLCKQNELGILKQYEIDKRYLSTLENRGEKEDREVLDKKIIATKLVSENDIRAKILRIPKDVKVKLNQATKIILSFNEKNQETFNIDKTGTFVGGVTAVFKKHGLAKDDGKYFPKTSVWSSFKDGFMVKFLEK